MRKWGKNEFFFSHPFLMVLMLTVSLHNYWNNFNDPLKTSLLHTKEHEHKKMGLMQIIYWRFLPFRRMRKKNTELRLKIHKFATAGILILIITTNRFAFRELKLIALSLCKQKMRWNFFFQSFPPFSAKELTLDTSIRCALSIKSFNPVILWIKHY